MNRTIHVYQTRNMLDRVRVSQAVIPILYRLPRGRFARAGAVRVIKVTPLPPTPPRLTHHREVSQMSLHRGFRGTARRVAAAFCIALYALSYGSAFAQTPPAVAIASTLPLPPVWQAIQDAYDKQQADITAAQLALQNAQNALATVQADQAKWNAVLTAAFNAYLMAAPITSPPPVTCTTPCTGPGESADKTVVNSATGKIIDSHGDTWTLVPSNTTLGNQIAKNGKVDTITGAVTELYYRNHIVYQEATPKNQWWQWLGTTWSSPVPDPRTP